MPLEGLRGPVVPVRGAVSADIVQDAGAPEVVARVGLAADDGGGVLQFGENDRAGLGAGDFGPAEGVLHGLEGGVRGVEVFVVLIVGEGCVDGDAVGAEA